MKKALGTLPWVEYRTIEGSRSTRLVKFGVNEKGRFSIEALQAALPGRYQKGLEVVPEPGDLP